MTSKEALNEVKNILYEEQTFKNDTDELLKTIEKDLEVLEILKKHIKNSVCLYTDLIGSLIENVEEYDKVKEWLDR